MTTPPTVGLSAEWTRALTTWESQAHHAGLMPSTIRRNARRLITAAREMHSDNPWTLTPGQVAEWFFTRTATPAAQASMRSALRVFYTWAYKAGLVGDNPALPLTLAQGARHARRIGATGPLPTPTPEEWQAPINAFTQWMTVAGKSLWTIKLRNSHLGKLARDLSPLGPFDVTTYDLLAWIQGQDWATETTRSARGTVVTFYRWATKAGLIPTDPAEHLPIVRPPNHLPRPATEMQIRLALVEATPTVRLMIRLAAEAGLRRAEVAAVHSKDLTQTAQGGWSLLVHGKGGRERIVPLPDSLANALRSLPEGWAFPSPNGGHLSNSWVSKKVGQTLPDGVSMHTLRHRFATRAYELDRDVFTVQELLGHASPVTTRRYVKVAQETLRSTVQRLADATTEQWTA